MSRKRGLCRHFERTGRCDRGWDCMFAHGASELDDDYRPAKYNQRPSAAPRQAADRPAYERAFEQTGAWRHKSKLCRTFEQNGYCQYGAACTFAHGAHGVEQSALFSCERVRAQQKQMGAHLCSGCTRGRLS